MCYNKDKKKQGAKKMENRFKNYYWANVDTSWRFSNDKNENKTGYNFRDIEKERAKAEEKRAERFNTRCY
jgi:hypothetical protein